ncbi:MAG: hypothetical protein Q9213_006258 [Squamulea squamosa]
MIYREVVLPDVDDAEMKRAYRRHWHGGSNVREGEKEKCAEALNFLLINKQINAEASKILEEERYYRSPVNWFDCYINKKDIESSFGHLSNMETLPTVRNVEITMSWAFVRTDYSRDCQTEWNDMESRMLGILCNDLASYSPRLKNVVVYLPCQCPDDHTWRVQYDRGAHWQRCFNADGLSPLLAPIRRLRSHNIRFVHECKSPVIAELQHVFQEYTAKVQSSEPVERYSREQIEWFDLRLQAKRRGVYEQIKNDLIKAWFYINDWSNDQVRNPSEQRIFQYYFEKARDRLESCRWDEELMLSVAPPAT